MSCAPGLAAGIDVHKMTDEPENQESKDEALQRRKEELEEELEAYAQAGVSSPNLLKTARWVSRAMYLGMAALAAYLLFSGWGSVSKKQYNEAIERAQEFKGKLDETRKERDDLASRAGVNEARAILAVNELEAERTGAPAADRALQAASALVDRAWGEKAYAAHWREKLSGVQPDAHGVDPVEGVKELLRQAAVSPAGMHFELLRETVDFGAAACAEGAKALLEDPSPAVRSVAGALLGRTQADGAVELLAAKAKTERDPLAHRELWFAWSVHALRRPESGVWTPEAWVGYTVRAADPTLDDLLDAYNKAPAERKLDLLALLAAAAGKSYARQMSDVATSQERSTAERIIAVRWFGDRKEDSGRAILKSLSEGKGPLATEAARTLDRLGS